MHQAIDLLRRLNHTYRHTDTQSALEMLCRVLITRNAVSGRHYTSQDIIKNMHQNVSAEIAVNPVSDTEFIEYYKAVEGIDKDALCEAIFLILSESKEYTMISPGVTALLTAGLNPLMSSVLITDAICHGPILYRTIIQKPKTHFTLTAPNALTAALLSSLYPAENTTVIHADIYDAQFIVENYDMILSVPEFAVKMPHRRTSFISTKSDQIALENLLRHLKPNGILKMVMPPAILNGELKEQIDLRTYIVNKYKILEASALPRCIFSSTGIATVMLTISTGTTETISIKNYVKQETRRSSDVCQKLLPANDMYIPVRALDHENGWYIERLFLEDVEGFRDFTSDEVPKLNIGQIARTVFRGKALTDKSLFTPDGPIGVINISDITEKGIILDNISQIEGDERKVRSYIIEDGDLLLTSRGTAMKFGIFRKPPYSIENAPKFYIPAVNLTVIRPDPGKVRSEFLKIFFESPIGMRLFDNIRLGAALLNLNVKDIQSLQIPNLSAVEQDKIIEKYKAGHAEYLESVQAAKDKWDNILSDIYADFISKH